MTDLATVNATQVATIERLRIELGSARERNEVLQGMVDWLQNRVAQLECPKYQAERHFKGQA